MIFHQLPFWWWWWTDAENLNNNKKEQNLSKVFKYLVIMKVIEYDLHKKYPHQKTISIHFCPEDGVKWSWKRPLLREEEPFIRGSVGTTALICSGWHYGTLDVFFLCSLVSSALQKTLITQNYTLGVNECVRTCIPHPGYILLSCLVFPGIGSGSSLNTIQFAM